jgi:hypothetical protein
VEAPQRQLQDRLDMELARLVLGMPLVRLELVRLELVRLELAMDLPRPQPQEQVTEARTLDLTALTW